MTTARALLFPRTSGGGGGSGGDDPRLKKDVLFFDYDGTLLHAFDRAELTELPPLPTRDGLDCQGWNFTLDDISERVGRVAIGAVYVPTNGVTRLRLSIKNNSALSFSLKIDAIVSSGAITVNWGDGGAVSFISSTGAQVLAHRYPAPGRYVIEISRDGRCTFTIGDGKTTGNLTGDFSAPTLALSVVESINVGIGCTISDYAIANSSVSSISFPEGTERIPGRLAYAAPISWVSIPRSVTEIGAQAFQFSSVSFVCFPKFVNTLPNQVAAYSATIRSISIPPNMSSMPPFLGYLCPQLEDICVSRTQPPSTAATFQGLPSDLKVVVPAEAAERYRMTTNWSALSAQIVGV